MRYRIVFALAAAIAVTAPSLDAASQRLGRRADTTSSMIVVFHDHVDLGGFAQFYRADDRAVANAAAWDYLDKGVAGFVQDLEGREQFRAHRVYSHSIRGFAARLNARQIAALRNDPNVAYIEPDGIAYAVAQTLPWGVNKMDADVSSRWAGDGPVVVSSVNVYILDTGVADHRDLNKVGHVNFVTGGSPTSNPNTDCHGHGTHVAGTVAAIDNTVDVVGVVPGAPVTGVKVLGCIGNGSYSDVIQGVDWVTANASRPAVANMSLAGPPNQALDDAVKRSAASGVFYAVAAGNSGADACNYSPARAGTAVGVLTVAATDSADNEAGFSNYGPCVDMWGPGVGVLSTALGGGTASSSGTSMASPHGAGAGALYLSLDPNMPASTVEYALIGAATTTAKASKDGRTIIRLYVSYF